MKKYVNSSEDLNQNHIVLKFKGQIYEDGWMDNSGHIRFGQNEFEYVPQTEYNNGPYVIIHRYKPISNGYTHTSRKSTAKITIL